MTIDIGNKSPDHTGTVDKWFESNGYGFIKTIDGDNVFVHISKVENNEHLSIGQSVKFDLLTTPKGLQAVNVRRDYTSL